MGRDPDNFGPYERFLDVPAWPSESTGEVIAVADMAAPQQAASALAKLVRWARTAPAGNITRHPDEDSREEAVRQSRLGQALIARAANMTEEHFHAVYGEYGALPDASLHDIASDLVVWLGDIESQWTWEYRIKIAVQLLNLMDAKYALKEKLT